MYYIRVGEEQTQDNTIACLVWRVVQSFDPQKIKLENYTPDKKMQIDFTEGQLKATIEVNIIKKFYIDDDVFEIGFLDDETFLYEKQEG